MTCCHKPRIANMDFKWPMFAKYGEHVEIRVNRVCLTCFTHWSGAIESPLQHTRKEWDVMMEVCIHE